MREKMKPIKCKCSCFSSTYPMIISIQNLDDNNLVALIIYLNAITVGSKLRVSFSESSTATQVKVTPS